MKRTDGGTFAPKTCHIAVLRPFFRADCRLCDHSTPLRQERNRVIEEHEAHVAETHPLPKDGQNAPERLAGAVTLPKGGGSPEGTGAGATS